MNRIFGIAFGLLTMTATSVASAEDRTFRFYLQGGPGDSRVLLAAPEGIENNKPGEIQILKRPDSYSAFLAASAVSGRKIGRGVLRETAEANAPCRLEFKFANVRVQSFRPAIKKDGEPELETVLLSFESVSREARGFSCPS